MGAEASGGRLRRVAVAAAVGFVALGIGALGLALRPLPIELPGRGGLDLDGVELRMRAPAFQEIRPEATPAPYAGFRETVGVTEVTYYFSGPRLQDSDFSPPGGRLESVVVVWPDESVWVEPSTFVELFNDLLGLRGEPEGCWAEESWMIRGSTGEPGSGERVDVSQLLAFWPARGGTPSLHLHESVLHTAPDSANARISVGFPRPHPSTLGVPVDCRSGELAEARARGVPPTPPPTRP